MKTLSGYRAFHSENAAWDTAGESSRAWHGNSSGTLPSTDYENDGLSIWAGITSAPRSYASDATSSTDGLP